MAGATEPADDAREVHGCAVEGRVPRDSAAQVRALPIEGHEATGTTNAEDIAFGAIEVAQPELACADANRIGRRRGNLPGRDGDNAAEAFGLSQVEETIRGSFALQQALAALRDGDDLELADGLVGYQ